MFRWLFLIFVVVPLLDLWTLLRIGSVLHFWPTLALVLGMGALGAFLARRQGLRTLLRIQQELAAGRMPTAEMADGVVLLFAAALLVAPGCLTDVAGLLLLIPWFRAAFRKVAGAWFARHVRVMPPMPGHDPSPGPAPFIHVVSSSWTTSESPDRPVKFVENKATKTD